MLMHDITVLNYAAYMGRKGEAEDSTHIVRVSPNPNARYDLLYATFSHRSGLPACLALLPIIPSLAYSLTRRY